MGNRVGSGGTRLGCRGKRWREGRRCRGEVEGVERVGEGAGQVEESGLQGRVVGRGEKV